MVADWKTLTPSGKKRLSGLLIAFFALQVGFDLGHSVTAFPFVHYGMFSERFRNPDSLPAYQVTVDGHTLRAADFGIYRWDMIQQPLLTFDKLIRTGDFSADKARIRAALPGLYSLVAANLDNSRDVAARFPDWYRRYLSRLLRRPIGRLAVDKTVYVFTASGLRLTGDSSWINIDR